MYVTNNEIWQCPKCKGILKKRGLNSIVIPGLPISTIMGTNTCSRCGANYSQQEIYGGKYDIITAAKVSQTKESPKEVHMVVHLMSSIPPPTNPKLYCAQILKKKYRKAGLGRFYVIGTHDNFTLDDAYLNYLILVSKGNLSDLGEQFDAELIQDSSNRKIPVLYLK